VSDPSSKNGALEGTAAGTLHFLNREPPEHYRREWTERIAASKTADGEATRSALVFRIGAEWLALPAQIFQQVANQCPLHTVPHRQNPVLLGLVNIRGELLLCASLGALLGISEIDAPLKVRRPQVIPRLLVARRQGNRVAFPVDEIHNIMRYAPASLRPAPSTLTRSNIPYTVGLLPWQEKTVGCLDDERLFHQLDESFR
jgi:chemotaxis-related protein WspD